MREVRERGRIAHALRLRPRLLTLFLTATSPLSSLVIDKPDDVIRFSLSVGSFSVVNNIVPRVELEAYDLLSIPALRPTADPHASFPANAADWRGGEVR